MDKKYKISGLEYRLVRFQIRCYDGELDQDLSFEEVVCRALKYKLEDKGSTLEFESPVSKYVEKAVSLVCDVIDREGIDIPIALEILRLYGKTKLQFYPEAAIERIYSEKACKLIKAFHQGMLSFHTDYRNIATEEFTTRNKK